jgi:hypothetical protein
MFLTRLYLIYNKSDYGKSPSKENILSPYLFINMCNVLDYKKNISAW